MGQYYMPTLIRNGEMTTFYSWDYNNGLKLTEHSWIGNNFVGVVLKHLEEFPSKVWWLGDYAEPNDFKNDVLSPEQIKEAWDDSHNVKTESKWDWKRSAYLVNLNKKCYVKIDPISIDWNLCPLPLLTAVGNGKGGGDYRGINEYDVGAWAGDMLFVTRDIAEIPDEFTDESDSYSFKEEW